MNVNETSNKQNYKKSEINMEIVFDASVNNEYDICYEKPQKPYAKRHTSERCISFSESNPNELKHLNDDNCLYQTPYAFGKMWKKKTIVKSIII